MNSTTYAVYGVNPNGKRDYIGTVDEPADAERIARRWLADYPQTVISADALTTGGTWNTTEWSSTETVI